MREIKFRGRDKIRKEWVYGYYYTFGDRAFIIEPGQPGIPEQHIEIVPESFGQFTGLMDQTAEPIYQGDIVKYVNEIYQIADGLCNFLLLNNTRGFPLTVTAFPDLKVIGNIYENPELLK